MEERIKKKLKVLFKAQKTVANCVLKYCVRTFNSEFECWTFSVMTLAIKVISFVIHNIVSIFPNISKYEEV